MLVETAKGTIFVSLEDESGVMRVIVWKRGQHGTDLAQAPGRVMKQRGSPTWARTRDLRINSSRCG